MDLVVQQITKEQEDLVKLNRQLQIRSQKFGAEFTPLTLSDYKLFKIQKARETGKIQYLDNILLEEIEDLQERKNKIKQRLQQFYPELKVQSEDKFFAERQNPDLTQENVTFRDNTWYLFGVDYMSNELLRNYFHIHPHFRIEWINDSSCNIAFNNKEEADEAVLPLIKGAGMKDEADIWYQLPEYEVEGNKRKLFCRLATTKDVKKQEVTGHNSKYYRWKIDKQKFGNYVKKKAYQQIVKTKGINREDRYHNSSNKNYVKKEQRRKKEEEDSSSGVENDSQSMKEE